MQKVTVTTSWDDGHVLDRKLAELLRTYELAGTFYVSPLDREFAAEERLTDAQILELSKTFEIGAHTLTHPRLTQITDEEATTEITGSKKHLEEVIGRTITSFCYPAGYYLPKHVQRVKDAGFTLARTVVRFNASATHPLELGTTVHAYRHWSDAWDIMKAVGLAKFLRCYFNWDELAIELFEKTQYAGGIFHIWGHSWEIDKNHDWLRLEKVFKHIAHKKNVQYLPNRELV